MGEAVRRIGSHSSFVVQTMNFHDRIGQGIGIVTSAEAIDALVWEKSPRYALAPALRNLPATSYRVGLPDVSEPLR